MITKRKIRFEIEAVKDVIRNKEARGESARFERKLLESWANYEGWEDARMPLDNTTIQNQGHKNSNQ